MANEIQIVYGDETATVYSIIRRESDNKVYNPITEAFETWDDADVADYAIEMTYQGGDVYAADHPDIATSTNYVYITYLQAGATPATTDLVLNAFTGTWDTTTTSETPVSAYALAGLSETKAELGVTTSEDDSVISQLINEASAIFEALTERKIAARDYIEFQRTRGHLVLTHQYPLIWVKRIAWGTDNAIELKITDTDLIQVQAYTTLNDALKLAYTDSDGDETVSSFSFSTYKSTDALVTAINAASIGVQAVLKTNVPSKYILPMAGLDVREESASIKVSYWDTINHYTMEDHGQIGLADSQYPSHVLIEYRAGYETIPDDITKAVIEMVKYSYQQIGANPHVTSESLGDYSYTISTESVSQQLVQSIVHRYKRQA